MRLAVGRWNCIVLGLLITSAAGAAQKDLAWLRGKCGDGALAYEHGGSRYVDGGEIMLTELSTGKTIKIGRGRCPEFSPDSSKIAWLDGPTVKGRMRRGDATVHTIATGVDTLAGVHWYGNTEVLVVKNKKWSRVSLTGDVWQDASGLTSLGLGGTECDVKRRTDGVWVRVAGSSWKSSDGKSGSTGGTCACSLAPDAKSVTGLKSAHTECAVTRIASGGVSGKLTYGGHFDNHRWSSNDARFVAARDEKYDRMMVIEVGTSDFAHLGETGVDRGDFTVGGGQGDPWPGTPDAPQLAVSPGTLYFEAEATSGEAGGTDSSPQTVAVQNEGTGRLEDVTLAESAAWLAVSPSGSGNSQTLVNTVDISGLAPGTYTQTVQVSSANAANASQSYQVTLVVLEQPSGTTDPTITLTRPQPGDVWPAGTTQYIQWTTQNLDDIRIHYSTDNGRTWLEIASTVGPGPVWGKYPWVVPDDPSAQCRIRIAGYFGETTTQSGAFEIASGGPDTQPPTIVAAAVVIGGTVDDPTVSVVVLGGAPIPLQAGAFSGMASLASAAVVAVEAVDGNGNKAVRRLEVTR